MPDPKLYIIATPLGNREDITLRALTELKRLRCFFAEDSREFLKLLELYEILGAGKKVHSYASHNMKEATEAALRVLRSGEDVGLVTDRGTPCISDPGAWLVRCALDEGIGVTPIPGASSVTALLSVSGFSADRFLFLGFLPTANGERDSLLTSLRGVEYSVCFFESPRRIRKTVHELQTLFPERRIFFGREMTKHFESFHGAKLSTLDPESLMEKGEYAVVLEGGQGQETKPHDLQQQLDAAIAERLAPDKSWAKSLVSQLGLSASEIYNALQQRKNSGK